MRSVHQSLCSFLGRVGQFRLNDGASWNGNRDQPGRDRIVSRQDIAGEREEKKEENGKRSSSMHGGILSARLARVKPEARCAHAAAGAPVPCNRAVAYAILGPNKQGVGI
jgi:hypothetical protein